MLLLLANFMMFVDQSHDNPGLSIFGPKISPFPNAKKYGVFFGGVGGGFHLYFI